MAKNWWAMAAVTGILFLIAGSLHGQKPGFENWEKGRDYYKNRDYKRAAEEFVRAFESDPSYIPYQEFVGRVLVNNLGDYDRAIALLEKAPNKGKSADTLYYLGKAYARKRNGDLTKALEYVEKAYDIEPTAKAKELVTEIKSRMPPEHEDGIWRNLAIIFGIIVISVSAVVVLRRFVFPQPSALRDLILFLVLVLVMVFSAAQLGIISGQQFVDIIKKMLSAVSKG